MSAMLECDKGKRDQEAEASQGTGLQWAKAWIIVLQNTLHSLSWTQKDVQIIK